MDTDTPKTDTAPAPAAPRAPTPFSALRTEIDRIFDEFGSGVRRSLLAAGPGDWAGSPAVEIAERDGAFELTAELPGLAPGDVDIRLSDGSITLRGEKSEQRREEKETYLLSERRYGAFRRTLPLPPGIDADAVTASFENGVLTVRMPKSDDARKRERRIEIAAP